MEKESSKSRKEADKLEKEVAKLSKSFRGSTVVDCYSARGEDGRYLVLDMSEERGTLCSLHFELGGERKIKSGYKLSSPTRRTVKSDLMKKVDLMVFRKMHRIDDLILIRFKKTATVKDLNPSDLYLKINLATGAIEEIEEIDASSLCTEDAMTEW